MNKTIYMTYKKKVPKKVIERWHKLNPTYNIDFSLDDDCIAFLKLHFNDYIAELFQSIPQGMYKADLWRLCKLYIHGGVYADIDLVPYLHIDSLDTNITFYSCLSIMPNSIFQAFMMTTPRNPLILIFLLSFLLNHPYKWVNGPTYDIYKCIQYNVNIIPEHKLDIHEVKLNIPIGPCKHNIKYINLHYFPTIKYKFRIAHHNHPDEFDCSIQNTILKIQRLDAPSGWGHHH